jgi:acetylornithine deacetylase/succinyl-diaminopimelate desuccinylase-like protein
MKYIDSNFDKFVKDLKILCKQPSISAQNKGTGECVEVLKEMMTEVGVDVNLVPIKDGNPVASGGGVGYPSSKVHASNENIRIRDYVKSIKYVAALINFYRAPKQ